MLFEEFNKPFSFNAEKVKAKQKDIYVCTGSDCTKKGTQSTLRREIEKYFKREQIGNLNCLGLCQKNHAFRYRDENYSAPTSDAVRRILGKD